MDSSDIMFTGARITTISWTREGFQPDIVAQATSLLNKFKDINIFSRLKEFFKSHNIKMDEHLIDNSKLDLIEEYGNEYIKILDLNENISIDKYNIKKFIIRVYICNKELGRRAKIYVSFISNLVNHALNSKEIVEMSQHIRKIEEDICDFIHKLIPVEYGLKDLFYIGNIISIESKDEEIIGLLQSTFDLKKNDFVDIAGDLRQKSKKLLDTYYVLINNKDLNLNNLDSNKIGQELISNKGQQSIILFNRENGDILVKALNREEGRNHRIITTLTQNQCASIVNKRLAKEYLIYT